MYEKIPKNSSSTPTTRNNKTGITQSWSPASLFPTPAAAAEGEIGEAVGEIVGVLVGGVGLAVGLAIVGLSVVGLAVG